ncbi:MAG: NAD(+) diphosphatase [Pseudomonadota bacterium]
MLFFPATDYSAQTGFGGNTLDRMSERRDDDAFINAQRTHASGRILLFEGDSLIMAKDASTALFDRDTAEGLGADWPGAIFLGSDDEGPLFAAPVEGLPEGAPLERHNLRALAVSGRVAHRELGAISQARSIVGWHATHRFCAVCGAPTVMASAGMRRECKACGAHHFPRTDPVVIMLAVDIERDRCLLGRQTRFPPGVYSCLAGFMEPGETIEAAVRREVYEEAGILTDRVAYHASQPWPFPSSLMIGCFAQATSTTIEPHDLELEDVRWFDRADVIEMLAGTHPTLGVPPQIAIAHHILSAYAAHGAPAVTERGAQAA